MSRVQNPHLLLISLGIPQDKEKKEWMNRRQKRTKSSFFVCCCFHFQVYLVFTLYQKSNLWRPTDWSPCLNSTLPWCPSWFLLPSSNFILRVSLPYSFQLYYLNPLTDRILLSSSIYCVVLFYLCSFLLHRLRILLLFTQNILPYYSYQLITSHHPLKYVIMEMIYYYLKVGKYVYYNFLLGDRLLRLTQHSLDLLKFGTRKNGLIILRGTVNMNMIDWIYEFSYLAVCLQL